MALTKAALEALARAGKQVRKYDDVFDESLAASARASQAQVQMDTNKLRQMVEAQTAASNADATRVVLTPEETAVVDRQVASAFEVDRLKGITDPNAAVDFRYQTTNTVEFAARIQNQFNDPDFATRVVEPGKHDIPADSVRRRLLGEAIEVDKGFQAGINLFRTDKRYLQNLDAVMGDTPYKGADGKPTVMVHIDEMTDPTRTTMEDGFIQQTPSANQIGNHSGTNNAAITATIKQDDEGFPDLAFLRIHTLDEAVKDLDMKDDSGKVLINEFNAALERHFVQKFSEGGIKSNTLFDDFEKDAIRALERFIGDSETAHAEVKKWVSRAKRLPLANATPHYFNGKNGLWMEDTGGFYPEQVYRKLRDIFDSDADHLTLDALWGSALGDEAKTVALRTFIEDKGFDHIVYHNSVEDVGTISVIHWKPEQMVSIFDPRLTANTPSSNARTAAAYVMGGIFGGQAVKESTAPTQ